MDNPVAGQSSDSEPLLTSKRDRPILVVSNSKYHLKTVNKNGTKRWTCVNRDCSGSITTSNTNNVLRESTHTRNNCATDANVLEIEMKMEQCKKRVTVDLGSTSKIFEESMRPLYDKGYNLLTSIPQYKSKKDSLSLRRRKALKVNKTHFFTLDEVILPDMFKKYLICEDGSADKILIFGLRETISLLGSVSNYYCDGTFKCCCRPFNQLYLISADFGSTQTATNIFPVLMCLLPDKTENTYKRLFTLLRKNILTMQIQNLKIDYESGTLSALRKYFPDIQVTGCYFHFYQSIKKKARSLNINNSKLIQLCTSLALLPAEHIDEGWNYIKQKYNSEKPCMVKFIDYFEKQWMFNESLGRIWCCYNQLHRTTNAVEGWNHRLNNCRIEKRKSRLLFEYIQKIINELMDTHIKISQRETRRNRTQSIIQRDEDIKMTISLLTDKVINVTDCLELLTLK